MSTKKMEPWERKILKKCRGKRRKSKRRILSSIIEWIQLKLMEE